MNRQRVQIVPLFVLLIFVSGLLMLFDRNRITDPVRAAVEHYILKIRGGASNEPVSSEQLNAKIVSLENERDDLTAENRELRKQLQAPLPASYQFIPGIVLTRKIDQQHATLLISAGARDSVASGMPVVTEQILIGIILDATPHTARVRLLSDKDSAVAVKTDKGARGIVFGEEESADMQHGHIDRILQNEPLEVGDRIVTSGEDTIPAGLLIGNVSEIRTEPRDPFKKARVELAVDPTILDRIFVLKEN